jgi:peptidoglycan/LPS O-acetylase OafA/YrhL
MAPAERWPALDGLRALAVLYVVAYHLGLPYSVRGGSIGVTIFFALSGFLITSLLLRESDELGSIHLPAFFMRRALRLLPALVVLCAAVWTWAVVSDVHDRTRAAVPWVLLYAGNWERVIHSWGSLGALEHAWSLGVEEQFYVVWPLVVVLVGVLAPRARRATAVLVTSLAGAALSLVWRVHLWSDADPTQSAVRLYNGTDAVADQLLLGCALAAALHLVRARPLGPAVARAVRWSAIPALAFLTWVAAFRPGGPSSSNTRLYLTYGSTAFTLATVAIIASIVLAPGAPLSRLLSSPPLRAVGTRSYGIYLWHYPLIVAIDLELSSLPHNARRLLVVASCALITLASYRFVEQPALRVKRRFQRVRPAPARVPTPDRPR